jgi:hypothetical protein
VQLIFGSKGQWSGAAPAIKPLLSPTLTLLPMLSLLLTPSPLHPLLLLLWECLTVACKAFSLANAKGKGVNALVIRSLDD